MNTYIIPHGNTGLMEKTQTVLSYIALLLLTSLFVLPVFAVQDSQSNTTNGYTADALVWGTEHGALVYPFTWETTASCTPGTDHCTTSGYNLTIYGEFVFYSGGNEYCYFPGCTFLAIAQSSSTYSGNIEESVDSYQATLVYNYAYVGYLHSSQFIAVTTEVAASIPAT